MEKPKLHLICNAHLDPVWQWRWEEGISEAIATFRNAVDILKEHEKLIFNHNESVLYEWVKKYDPALFKEIQKLVKKGRWNISGGWYLQPDVNMPGIESIIRQIKYGRKFFRQNFDAIPQVAYNFDSFGHGAGLPQVLNKAGYKMYIHMRPEEAEFHIPNDLYLWQGADGSEILTYRINIGYYHTERNNILDRLNAGKRYALKINRDVPVFWGLGNHGGGATREDLARIDEFIKNENSIEIIHSAPDIFYEAIKKYSNDVPVLKGDMQRVNTGCYTSLSRLKRKSLEISGQIIQTEALKTMTNAVYDEKYPQAELDEIWKDHLFNDFHDILPGSCTELAEQDALNQYGKIEISLRRHRFSIPLFLNKDINNESYIPLTIINTNTALENAPIEVECMIDYRPKWTGKWRLKLFDMEGKEIECQEEQTEALLPYNGWRRKIVFFDSIPQFGSKNYNIRLFEGEKEQQIFKPEVKFEINKNTGLIDHYSFDERNILTGRLLQPLVMEDLADSWGAGEWKYNKTLSKFSNESTPKIIEKGPVRIITETILKYNLSKIILHTIVYNKWNILEFHLRIHWNEERKRIKLSIPTIFNNPEILTEIPGGIIQRKADGEENIHHRWLFLRGNSVDNKIGLGIVNNGQFGFDFQNGEVRLSVLRSAAYCHEKTFDLGNMRYRKYMDQGIHDIKILLKLGNPEEVLNSLPGLAEYLSSPLVTFAHLPFGSIEKEMKTGRKKPDVPKFKNPFQKEFFTISQRNIRLLALKKSDEDDGIIFRLQETTGLQTAADLKLNCPEKTISLDFKPLEIKTLKITREGKYKEVNLIDEN
jgi:alpha-mannosidase